MKMILQALIPKQVSLTRVLFALAVAGVMAGCSPKKPKAKASNEVAAAESQKSSWNWDAYPAMTKMRIGNMACQLQPKLTMPIQSPLAGTLRVYVDSPQTNLPAGFLWAEFEPEIFAAEEKAIAEAETRLNEREKIQNEIEIPRQKLQMTKQLEEAKRQLDLQRYISTNKEFSDLIFSVGTNSASIFRPDVLDKSELEFSILNKSREFLEGTNGVALGLDLGAQRSDWERRKLEFERRQVQARFKMPFDGRLTLSVPLTEGVNEYPVNNAQELAVIRDLSSIRLRLPLANASWMSIPGEKLFTLVRLPNGELLEAKFSLQKIERIQNREEAAYYFQFPDAKAAVAARLIGTDVSCELWVALDQTVRIVPKLALMLRNPDIIKARSCAAGVAETLPGAKLVLEGQTDLGIAQPHDLKLSSAQ